MKPYSVGSTGEGKIEIKYGQTFPSVGEERMITSKYGRHTIKYTWVGTPEWTPKHTVLIPTKFKVIDVTELSNKAKIKQSGFQVL